MNELSDDSELEVARKAHWGGLVPMYHISVTMLEHDLYHAGEINRTHRTRALLTGRRCVVRADPPSV